MEHPIKIHDFGVSLFLETPILRMYQNQEFVSKKAGHTKCQTQGLSLKLCRILFVALAFQL